MRNTLAEAVRRASKPAVLLIAGLAQEIVHGKLDRVAISDHGNELPSFGAFLRRRQLDPLSPELVALIGIMAQTMAARDIAIDD